MNLRISLHLTTDETNTAIAALSRQNTPEAAALAAKMEKAIISDTAHYKQTVEAMAAEDAARAKRAATAALTFRQAESLAAVRAGKNIRARYSSLWGTKSDWHYSGSGMGGAIRRMLERLVEDGCVNRHHKLTDAGRDRLERWEAAHAGEFAWPTPEAATINTGDK